MWHKSAWRSGVESIAVMRAFQRPFDFRLKNKNIIIVFMSK